MMKLFFNGIVLAVLCFFLQPVGLLSQNQARVDSLRYDLEMARTDSVKVITLIELAREYSSGELPISMDYAQQALDLAETTKDNDLISQSLFTMGLICFYNGLLDMAARNYYRYLEIQRSLDNPDGITSALINVGSIKLQMMEFEDAKEIFLEALDYLNKTMPADKVDSSPPAQFPVIYNNLGVIYHNLQEYNKALDYYNKGILIAQRLADPRRDMANLLNNLGRTYDQLGKHDEALEAINQALDLRIEHGDKQGIGSSYRNLAIYYMSREQYAQALGYLHKGLSIAEEVGALNLKVNFVSQLFEYYDQRNQPDSALKYHKLLKEYTEQVNREETLRELTRLELTAHYQEMELIRQMEQKRKDLQYTLVAGLLLLIAVIAFLLWYLASSRAKRLRLLNDNIQLEALNTSLEKQNLENELEVKNKELTTNVMYQIRKNDLINEISQKLIRYSHELSKEKQFLIQSIVKDLESTQDESVWNEFEVRFHQVHNDFYDKLHEINPDLSLNERRLCAFLRLNMTSKEISSITGQSLRSIEVARTRLRKKLHLTNSDTNLTDFLLNV
ncbi:MAG: tetratricopeptide repeat protein [Bacteroidetes bacterium]|nr:MAG: tetratricopeptide repeat protein [Bacteroidota bacterium]